MRNAVTCAAVGLPWLFSPLPARLITGHSDVSGSSQVCKDTPHPHPHPTPLMSVLYHNMQGALKRGQGCWLVFLLLLFAHLNSAGTLAGACAAWEMAIILLTVFDTCCVILEEIKGVFPSFESKLFSFLFPFFLALWWCSGHACHHDKCLFSKNITSQIVVYN